MTTVSTGKDTRTADLDFEAPGRRSWPPSSSGGRARPAPARSPPR